ncbi:MAG: YihY family inner membrane protein [Rhodobiaceae bacterium]|nr:YihY family inner membrane protein [Rhodobiaceae bacterium]
MFGTFFPDLQAKVAREVWSNEASVSALKRPFIVAARIVWVVGRDLAAGQASLRAMSLVYTTLLSIVPVLALTFAILKAFGIEDQIETLMQEFLAPMGAQGEEITARVLQFVQQVNISVLGSVGLVFLVYTLISLIQKIQSAFNDIWHVASTRSLARQMAAYVSVGLLGPLVLFLAIGVIATTVSSFLLDTVGSFAPLRSVMTELNRLAPYGFMMLAFAFLYLVVPNTRVKISAAVIGGAIAGIMWVGTGWAFATFVVTSARYAAIYSAFASLVLFMIWLYAAWLILLVGCSVTYYFQNRDHLSPESGIIRLTLDQVKRLSLIMLTIIHRSFLTGDTPWTSERLSQRLGIPPQTVENIGEPLLRAGLVAWAGNGPRLVPTKPADMTKVGEVFRTVIHADRVGSASPETLGTDFAVDGLLDAIKTAEEKALDDRSINDLIKMEPSSS